MTDPIADFLTRLRNAISAKHRVVEVPASNLKKEITKILGMNITFVTSAETDEEGYALLKEFGLPFKNAKKD